MMKLLNQECIRKNVNLCTSEQLKLKFKHDTTTLEIADIETNKDKVSFIGITKIFSQIVETTTQVFIK